MTTTVANQQRGINLANGGAMIDDQWIDAKCPGRDMTSKTPGQQKAERRSKFSVPLSAK
jgi:hypothetical protein